MATAPPDDAQANPSASSAPAGSAAKPNGVVPAAKHSRRLSRRQTWFFVLLPMPLLLAIAVTGIVYSMHQAERQRDAINRVVANGGSVLFDYQLRQYGHIYQIDLGGKPLIPPWLAQWIDIGCVHDAVHVQYPPDPTRVFTTDGLSLLGNVRTVILGYSSANDADVLNMAGLRNLSYCDLTRTRISDAGLDPLTRTRDLKVLYVGETGISDAGCRHIEKLVHLHALGLQQTQVTDAGLARLRELVELRWLFLSETCITDAGLESLSDMRKMKSLRLSVCPITDAGLGVVGKMTDLEVLMLDGCAISDQGLAQLRGLTRLSLLSLNGTTVTDAGLEHLSQMTRLYALSLAGTRVTEAGVSKLRRRLPGLQISR